MGMPFSKILLRSIPPVALAGIVSLGACAGPAVYALIRKASSAKKEASLERKDLPVLAGAIITGGILGPIFIMLGLRHISGFAASLLVNLEALATAMIGVIIFRENAGKRFWFALACMIIAGMLITYDAAQSRFTIAGPLLVITAMLCWGTDNNLMRIISDKDPLQIAQIKGLVAGIFSLLLSFIIGEEITLNMAIVYAFLIGAICYGMSVVFFIQALKSLGSSRAGAFISIAPFFGAVVSLIILKEQIGGAPLIPAVVLMIIGGWMITSEQHSHEHTHIPITHTYAHSHDDMHHDHIHRGDSTEKKHTHEHTHQEITHAHPHLPDTHHRHSHE